LHNDASLDHDAGIVAPIFNASDFAEFFNDAGEHLVNGRI
jgi:hypothetical protein